MLLSLYATTDLEKGQLLPTIKRRIQPEPKNIARYYAGLVGAEEVFSPIEPPNILAPRVSSMVGGLRLGR